MTADAKVAICVNPMSGRDVRRLAALATNMTHEAKRDIVARIAAGAAAWGATDIYVAKEPFRIAAAALEHLDIAARVHLLDNPIRNSAVDTETNILSFLEQGCRVIVSLGGDGTNRAIVRALEKAVADPALKELAADVHLLALSTGTNNVFPVLAEPTIAGMVAALQATSQLSEPALKRRAKVLHVTGQRASEKAHELPDVGLIDAVLLRQDHVGNLLPYDAGLTEFCSLGLSLRRSACRRLAVCFSESEKNTITACCWSSVPLTTTHSTFALPFLPVRFSPCM